jgi:MFS family permease
MRTNSSLRLVVSRADARPVVDDGGVGARRFGVVANPTRGDGHGVSSWLTADLARVLGAASAWGFAFSTFYLLPKYLAQELGAGPSEIGFAVGIFSVATVAATPFAGWVVDRFPRRYAMMAGAVLMAISAIGFVGVERLGVVLDALRILQGLSYALVVTAVGTLVADQAPREHLNQALGFSGASMLIMNAVAPAVAEPLAAAVGWPTAFALAACSACLATALAGRVHEARWKRAATASGGMRALLAQPIARHYAIVIALSGATFGAVFTFEPAYALALGRTRVGGFFIAYAIAAIIVRLVFGGIPARVGSYRVARGALVLYAVVVFALAATGPAGLEPLGALFGLAHGLFYPAVNAMAVTAVQPHERGRMIAIFTGAFAVGLSFGSTTLGHVAAWGGYPLVFVTAACGTLVAVTILIASPPLRAAGAALREGR